MDVIQVKHLIHFKKNINLLREYANTIMLALIITSLLFEERLKTCALYEFN